MKNSLKVTINSFFLFKAGSKTLLKRILYRIYLRDFLKTFQATLCQTTSESLQSLTTSINKITLPYDLATLWLSTIDVSIYKFITLIKYSNRKIGVIAPNLLHFYYEAKLWDTMRQIMRHFLILNCSTVPYFSASESICKQPYVWSIFNGICFWLHVIRMSFNSFWAQYVFS